MNAVKALEIMTKYQNCPDCGNNKIRNGEGGLIVEDDTFTRKCKCGFSITVDENGKEKELPEAAVIKKFGIDFHSDSGALTLSPSDIGTHEDSWTVTGQIHEDYYEWVNDFEAEHPIYGRVWGDFEKKVYADCEEGFQDFYKNHAPSAWDYGDI